MRDPPRVVDLDLSQQEVEGKYGLTCKAPEVWKHGGVLEPDNGWTEKGLIVRVFQMSCVIPDDGVERLRGRIDFEDEIGGVGGDSLIHRDGEFDEPVKGWVNISPGARRRNGTRQ